MHARFVFMYESVQWGLCNSVCLHFAQQLDGELLVTKAVRKSQEFSNKCRLWSKTSYDASLSSFCYAIVWLYGVFELSYQHDYRRLKRTLVIYGNEIHANKGSVRVGAGHIESGNADALLFNAPRPLEFLYYIPSTYYY